MRKCFRRETGIIKKRKKKKGAWRREVECERSMCVIIVSGALEIVCTRLTSDLCLSFNVLQISPDGLGLPDRNYYYREPDHAVIIYFDSEATISLYTHALFRRRQGVVLFLWVSSPTTTIVLDLSFYNNNHNNNITITIMMMIVLP